MRNVKDPMMIRFRKACCIFLFSIAALWFALALPAFAANDSAGCAASPETRQLDYWLGDWVVSYPEASATSRSNVSQALDKCLVVERWDDGKGHIGENMFGYSPDDKSWKGMFADNHGHVHVFVDGKVASGAAEFYGPSRGPNGETVLNRIRITRIASDRVEQIWEKSKDNGATWADVFRGTYTRKNP